MLKKGVFVATILSLILFGAAFLTFSLLIASQPALAEDTYGCCANPGVVLENVLPQEYYCSQYLDESSCCPSASSLLKGGYNATNPFFPDDQADCQANFYSAGSCTDFPKCSLGCCYDPGAAEVCSIKTEFFCRQTIGTDWQIGDCESSFHDCESTGEIPPGEEPPVGEDPCLAHSDSQASCTAASGCYWCPTATSTSKCFSQCLGNCPYYSTDIAPTSAPDHVCDEDATYYDPCASDSVICQKLETESCICGSIVVPGSQYCCARKGLNFTDPGECESSCAIDCLVGQSVSMTAFYNSGYGYTSCKCGPSILASFATQGSKYCCLTNNVYSLKDTVCNPLGRLSGHVYDNTTPSSPRPFAGATVTIAEQSIKSGADGSFQFENVPAGEELVITAYNDSFLQREETVVVPSTGTTIDLYLNPLIESCDNPKTYKPDMLGFTKQCSVDNKLIRLSWVNPCSSKGTFIMFQLYRNGVLLQTFDGTRPSYTFDDSSFGWNSYANYTLNASYDTMLGSGITNSSLRVFTGYEQCIGKGSAQLCVNGQIIECNSNCVNDARENCTKSKKVCVGPDTYGLASCVADQECLNLGNPFGVFYQVDTCNYNAVGELNPCYYDYSSTIIDKCYKCSSARKCSDFISTDACLSNHCSLSGRCLFMETNPELGKGICYREDDPTSDSCEKCNELFMGCDERECSQLGSCVMSGGICGSCSQIHSCSDYDNEYSCDGGHPYTITPIPNCNAVSASQFSNDSCGLNYCKWTGTKCIMDLDGDGQEDIGTMRPPVTTVTMPSGVLNEGDAFKFGVKIVGTSVPTPLTYACISDPASSASACCPNILVNGSVLSGGNTFTGASLVLNKTLFPNVGQGIYTLYYYSTYKQIPTLKEAVKNVQFYVDMQPPEILDFKFTLEPSDPVYNSNLNISFKVDENAFCTGRLIGADKNPVRPLNRRTAQEYFVRYLNMTDGEYQYVIDCNDSSGNSAHVVEPVLIDRVQLIISVEPRDQTFKQAQEIKARTDLGPVTCAYYQTYPLISPIVPQDMNKIDMGTYLLFTSPTKVGTRGSFSFKVACYESSKNLWDYANSYFTTDDVAPISSFYLAPPGGVREKINSSLWYSNESVFTILCEDPNIGSVTNYPPVFGCYGTRFCVVDLSAADCTPTSAFDSAAIRISKLQKAKKYCYQSRDKGNNTEIVSCTNIRIDSLPPSKPVIVTPTYGKRDLINGSFTSVDDGLVVGDKIGSGVHHFSYRILNSTNATVQNWTTSFIIDNSSFNLVVAPTKLQYAGVYYIEVKAYDSANPLLASETARSNKVIIQCSRGPQYTICDGNSCVCDLCGDGNIDEENGEECDEGDDNSNTNICTSKCKNAVCGDGYLYNYFFKNGNFSGTEECDLGANNNKTGYACSATCRWLRCGNGYQETGEECDNGDVKNTAGNCINCYKARCGDGFTQTGVEACDPKDPATKSGCNQNCTKGGTGVDTCKNGLKDGDETGIDCGGTCATKCAGGTGCQDDGDCLSGYCKILIATQSGVCVDDTCSNSRQDIGESDVDCGAVCQTLCGTGKKCKLDADCSSGKCVSLLCAAPSCDDGKKNGEESDVDCGGTCSTKCGDGKKCISGSDCTSGSCKSGYCEQNRDKDKDGMDDEWEVENKCPDGHCDPDEDPDRDGLTNLEEFETGCTDPFNKDSDGDRWSDGDEVEKGEDPCDSESHPKSSFPWWIFILLIIILIILAVVLAMKKGKKKEESKTNYEDHFEDSFKEPMHTSTVVTPPPQIRQPPVQQQPQFQPRRPVFADHSDLFSAFDDKSGGDKGKQTDINLSQKSSTTVVPPSSSADKKLAKDMEEGFEMPGWMKDKGGVWKRLESMNKEELGRMGKISTDVHEELSSMYGKRLDKSLKDSLSNWVLTGMISKANLQDIISALSKEGKLNKAVMRYIISDMLDEKKINKTEMYAMLKKLEADGMLSENDADEFTDYVKSLGR